MLQVEIRFMEIFLLERKKNHSALKSLKERQLACRPPQDFRNTTKRFQIYCLKGARVNCLFKAADGGEDAALQPDTPQPLMYKQ